MAFYAFAHLGVRNVPVAVLDDDDFHDRLWHELPDVSVGTRGGPLEMTLSQFAFTDEQVARRQVRRAERALAAVGFPGAEVEVEEIERLGLRDDVEIAIGGIRWYVDRLVERVMQR